MQTATDILDVLEKWAEEKMPVDPGAYLDAALKLAALMGNEADKLYLMEQNVAKTRVEYLQGGMTSAAAKVHIEASDEYRACRTQKSLLNRIEETIRLSKARSRLAIEEKRSQ